MERCAQMSSARTHPPLSSLLSPSFRLSPTAQVKKDTDLPVIIGRTLGVDDFFVEQHRYVSVTVSVCVSGRAGGRGRGGGRE